MEIQGAPESFTYFVDYCGKCQIITDHNLFNILKKERVKVKIEREGPIGH